jgi:phosphoenolpyruvate synthase/pyruvate phosphate dikinase
LLTVLFFNINNNNRFTRRTFFTINYGLGEMVVQGAVNPDEFYLSKPLLNAGRHSVLRTTSRKPDSVSSVNITPAAPVSERTIRWTPAESATMSWSKPWWSATAEDLPDASFAGQQETFLNIRGIDNVLIAIKECKHYTRSASFRTNHTLNTRRKCNDVMIKTLVHTMLYLSLHLTV